MSKKKKVVHDGNGERDLADSRESSERDREIRKLINPAS